MQRETKGQVGDLIDGDYITKKAASTFGVPMQEIQQYVQQHKNQQAMSSMGTTGMYKQTIRSPNPIDAEADDNQSLNMREIKEGDLLKASYKGQTAHFTYNDHFYERIKGTNTEVVVEPIPLDENWLRAMEIPEKLYYDTKDEMWYMYTDCFMMTFKQKAGEWTTGRGDKIHIHQIQQLYYFGNLCKNEMVINNMPQGTMGLKDFEDYIQRISDPKPRDFDQENLKDAILKAIDDGTLTMPESWKHIEKRRKYKAPKNPKLKAKKLGNYGVDAATSFENLKHSIGTRFSDPESLAMSFGDEKIQKQLNVTSDMVRTLVEHGLLDPVKDRADDAGTWASMDTRVGEIPPVDLKDITLNTINASPSLLENYKNTFKEK